MKVGNGKWWVGVGQSTVEEKLKVRRSMVEEKGKSKGEKRKDGREG